MTCFNDFFCDFGPSKNKQYIFVKIKAKNYGLYKH